MSARSGMANLILRLRGMTEAGTADYTLAGVAYWSDDQLQAVLDSHRTDLARELLRSESEYAAADTEEWHNYYIDGHANFEEAASGTAVWDVEDSSGDTLGTANYTVNYDAGHIRVTADTEGEDYYLNARAYDLNAAAGEVWEKKASHAAKGYAFSADGASFHREQVYDHCLKMAEHYRGKNGMVVARLFRSDVNG